MTPLVSVLVPVYNHGPFLADSLDSILKQRTTFDFEVLVGEDHSTDDSYEIASDYARRHPGVVRIVRGPANEGMHANLRRLIRGGRGEYLAFCDGDDYWNTCDKLAVQARHLDEHPDVGAVHTDFDHIALVDGTWRALHRYWRHHGVPIPQGEVFEPLVRRNFVQTCTIMVRAELARRCLTDLDIAKYKVGDWPLMLFVSLHSSIAYLDASTATYRKVPGSATNSGFDADLARARDQVTMATDFCRLAGSNPDLEEAAHREAMRVILDRAVRAGDRDAVREAAEWLSLHGEPSLTGPKGRARLRLMTTAPGLRLFRRRIGVGRAEAMDDYRAQPHRPEEC